MTAARIGQKLKIPLQFEVTLFLYNLGTSPFIWKVKTLTTSFWRIWMKLFYANTKVNTDVKYENVISSVSDRKTVFYAFNSTYQSGKKIKSDLQHSLYRKKTEIGNRFYQNWSAEFDKTKGYQMKQECFYHICRKIMKKSSWWFSLSYNLHKNKLLVQKV